LIEEVIATTMPVTGCFTPTEILAAGSGAGIVKVFPQSALGPTFFGKSASLCLRCVWMQRAA
jgi:2-keto-3-deoxy-6-phosphogluconate aldolase